MSKHEHSPLPWTHKTGYGKTSAVVDADGKVVSGSLICEQTPQDVENHRLIVANSEEVERLRKDQTLNLDRLEAQLQQNDELRKRVEQLRATKLKAAIAEAKEQPK